MAEASVSVLVSSLTALAEKTESFVQATREEFEKRADLDFHQFLLFHSSFEQGISRLLCVLYAYAECMKSVGVKTKAELEQLWTKHYSEDGVKAAVESLLLAEKHYTQLIDTIDEKLSPHEEKSTTSAPAQTGEALSKDCTLIEIPSGQPRTLEAYWKEAKYTLFVLLRLFG